MPLTPGTRLGPYEILAPLGAGGMGEVYRARDPRLGREVAIKVLPQHLSSTPEVRARFEREAKTVSSLNHPHICTLHDVGREGDTDFLVMELVEGETLAARLTRGALPTAEVLRLGAQIADALDRAHRAGVVHRDLKPGNVMLTRSGAKLMDFGLARATGMAAPGSGGASLEALTQSPTVAAPLTAEGTIVGTFQYMSPEQLEGREADARSDLWALGCVLYEMATGKRAFEGRSQASLIGAIMNSEPAPLSQTAPTAPPALDQVIRACMTKDPEQRLQTAHDARLQLQWAAAGGSQGGAAAPLAVRRARIHPALWGLAGALVALAAVFGWGALHRPAAGPAGTLRVSVLPPEGANIDDDELHVAIAPNGAAIVFVATDSSGTSELWVRDLENSDARRLPGTEQAILPFWSPDSRFIGFFAEGKLKKVDVAGRNVQIVCDAPDGRGGAWSPRGVIVFAPASMGGLVRVPEGGGNVTAVTTLDTTRHEGAHRFPCFLPDGTHFLYGVLSSEDAVETRLGRLGDMATSGLVAATGTALFAAPGHVLFARNGALLAQRFDVRRGRLVGEPQVLGPAPSLTRYAGGPPGSVSANGVIAQRHRAPGAVGLAWLDREGRRIGAVPAAASQYSDLALSPDDEHAALLRHAPDGGTDVWTIELTRGVATRLTFDRPFCEKPVWSPDGRWIAFSAMEGTRRNIYRKLSSGAGNSDLSVQGTSAFTNPACWSRDGRYFLYRDLDPVTGEDIWAVPEAGDRKPFPVLRTRYHEEDASLSPDGRWLAYRSNESGRAELYLQSFPTPAAKYRISPEGAGTQSRSNFGRAFWRSDGRELVYVAGDGVTLMSVPIETAAGFHAGAPRALFRIPAPCSELVPGSDLRRFLVLENQSTKESSSIQLIMNWPAELKGR